MSDRFGLKVKENAGKTKYSSLNLNQTYKGTKVETKTSSGTARHGLQSLGKVGASRRIPPPANLPSLKSENSGNDPTVSLVPSGGGGWGSAKEKPSETTPAAASQAAPPSSTPSQTNAPSSQQPLLQPQRPIPPPSHPQPVQPQSQSSGQTQNQPAKQQESQVKTWGTVSSNEAGGQGRSYSHQEMPYFNREFPVLGGGNSGERPPLPSEIKEQPPTQYGQKQIMRNTHEPPWMERSGPGPPPSDYGTARERTDAFNGGPGHGGGHQYRRPPDYPHGSHGRNVPQGHLHHHGNGPQSHGPGRHPHGYPPDHFSRGPGQRPSAPSGPNSAGKLGDKTRGEGYGRPSILKPEDIQAMTDNDEEEEGGWAGAQDEVDYAAKLDFEDFEDDDKPSLEQPVKPEIETPSGEPETRWQGNESRPAKGMGPPPTRPAWTESSGPVYSENRQMPPSPGMRPFDSRGSPPNPGWPMPYPQHLAGQPRGGHPPGHPPPSLVSSDQVKPASKSEEPVTNDWQKRRVKQQEEMRAAVERARKRREEDEMRRQAEQKAGATAKLKELELKRVRRESAKEGDDAWAEELDSIEKDSYGKGPYPEQRMPETPEREVEPQNLALNQQDDLHGRNDFPEHVSHRQRNDSESSDASRSSARGASRPHHHPPRDIPPRFQQQQLRQQHFQQQQHYQQQQPYPPQHPYHQQQMARSPQLRDFPEGSLSVANHPIVDSGPVSPSQPTKPDVSVKRIMKRSDSSSTAGDDIASVKSLESASGEPSREVEKKPHAAPSDKAIKTDAREEKTKEGSSEATRKESNRTDRKPDDQDLPVFDDSGSGGSGDTSQKRTPDSVLPQGSGKQDLTNKENDVSKERVHDKRERKDDESTSKAVSEKGSRFRDRRDERRSSSKRDSRTQDNRRSDDSKDSGKRKREDSEDAERFTERRGRFAGRGGDPKRERFSESHSRGRVSFPVRGRGMAGTATSYRGRGRGDRGNRDNRDYKEHKQTRSREPRPSSAWKTTKDEQKRNEEDKENVVAKENANAIASESDKKVTRDSTEVKQDKRIESVPSTDEKEANKQEKRNEETVTEVKKNKEDDSVIRESKFEEEVRLPNKDLEKVKESDDVSKKPESPKDVNNLKPKARGGFGRPPQSSQELRNVNNQDRREGGKKFNDRRRPIQEAGRDRKTDSDDKRTGRNYSRDNTNQRQTGRDNRYRERGQERDQKFQYQRDERDTGNKRYSQDDRKKRFDDKDDDQQNSRRKGDERNQRGGTRSYSSRGRVSTTPVRTNIRGGRSSQPVGSGRFGNNYRRVKSSEEELSDDDYESDSSSYTTATSASEERRDEKPSNADNENDVKREKESSSTFDKSRASSRSARSPIRGKMSSRAGRRGTGGGFGRTRREVERPPRFQKQQEKERASMGRGAPQGVRTNESRESGPGRGRGRGRGKREQPQRDEGPGIPVTEDWDEELNEAQKGTESSKSDKSGGRRESTPRRGFSGPRSSSERGRKDKSRDAGGTRGNSSRREPFLAERQQAKVDGSKLVGGEPRGPLPAARNGFSKDGNRRSDMHSTGLDSINTGVTDTKTPKKQETPVRKTDIQQFDLHNIAGVICIDDMTDDESDKSSTHSGFVEVTSRRTQKENKDRQREEEERRKKVDEQNRQRGSQMGNKKNQSSKPPRFSKQHTSQVNTQSKSPGVIGKATSTAVSETAIGTAITGSNSNPSSANSTKRNSPVNVERPVSPPPPPPVFNAWDKPLLLTPAKPPSASPPVTSSIPDPLAVGSGKPSSTRVVQPQGTVISSAASLIEDISVDDDYLAMTKEIALLAPPEEPEESEEPAHITQNTKLEKRDQTMEKGAKVAGPSEKRSQAKPQRDKPPRFDRSSKRKAASGAEDAKKEWSSNTKGRKSSRDDTVPQKLTKGSADNTAKGKTGTLSSKKQQSASTGDEVANDRDTSKGEQESAEYISAGRNVGTTVSDEGSDGKDDIKEEEAKNDSGSESSRKDSELDLNVDSGDRNDDNEHLFGTETLSVDIHERPTAERPDREPSPVSPAIFEMSKKMEASRKLWDSGIAIGRSSNHGGAWEETLRTPASVGSSIVGMSVVESAESRLSDDQVAVKKPQVELEANTSKNDSKSPDGLNFAKKSGSGEQQNVCKVKPQQQQQQPVKTQQSSSIVSQPAEENHQTELNTVSLVPPLLSQELLTQQAMQHRYAIPLVGAFVDAPQRQPFLQQQQLQQLQQTNQQVTPTFSLTHVQQVNQARSSSSPLSQATQDMYQSPFLPGGVYSTGNFQGSQPYVSIGLLPSTATQSFVTSSPRTQTTSLIGIQAQQPKPGTGSVFAQNVTQQGTQTMFMQYDPKTLRGGTPLFNIAQHPQSAQRQLLGTQPGVVGENLSRQSGFPAGQPTPQPFQGTYPFQQKQGTYDVSQDMQMKKTAEQSTDFTRQSELVKHVNAKPFEPPKRSTPGSVPPSSASIGPLMSSTFARNPNLMTITPSPTDIGGSSQSPPVSTTLLSGRQVSMSPVEPGIPFHGAVGTFPKHTINQFQLQQQPQGVQPQQFTPFQQQPVSLQQTIQVRAQGQQQQQGGNPLQGAGTAILPNPAVIAAAMPRQLIRAPSLGPIGIGGAQPSATNTQRFPAPIQRPVTASLMHGVPHIQAPRGPRAQTAPPPPPQMMSAKQQIVTNRPHLPPQSLPHPPPQSLPHPEAVAAAFKIEQHHKMLEQTKMFFAQQQGPQQRVPLLSNQGDPQVKPIGSFQGDKPIVKGQVPRENLKFQEKKEEAKSHISETNQRNRKPNLEQPSKTSKTTKVDSKPEESSKDKTNTSKQDGKGPGNKSSSLVRIPPLPMAPRNVPKRARAPPRMPGSQPVSKPRISGRPEKEIKDTVQDQPSETPSRKSSDQAKPSEAQPVAPLSVNK